MRTVAIATCRALPDGDEDAQLLRDALRAHSIVATWLPWDDPDSDWDAFALTVVRSTWDYTADRGAFLRWAAGVANLHNGAASLAWNSDKTYLRELAEAAIPVVPTQWAAPGHALTPLEREFVLKPSVGAGSKGVGRFDPRQPGALDAASRHVGALQQAGRTVMIQPYFDAVDLAGESALVYIAGRFAHAITKHAMLVPDAVNPLDPDFSSSLWQPERIESATASSAELEVGQQVIDVVGARFGEQLYARVDLLPSDDGPVVVEVELVEPSLFLLYDPATAARLADAIADLVDRNPAGAR